MQFRLTTTLTLMLTSATVIAFARVVGSGLMWWMFLGLIVGAVGGSLLGGALLGVSKEIMFRAGASAIIGTELLICLFVSWAVVMVDRVPSPFEASFRVEVLLLPINILRIWLVICTMGCVSGVLGGSNLQPPLSQSGTFYPKFQTRRRAALWCGLVGASFAVGNIGEFLYWHGPHVLVYIWAGGVIAACLIAGAIWGIVSVYLIPVIQQCSASRTLLGVSFWLAGLWIFTWVS